MRCRKLVFSWISLLCLPLLAQGPALVPADQTARAVYSNTPYETIVGCRFVAIRSGALFCNENGQRRSVRVARSCTVWKGREARDFSAVRPGDSLDIRIRKDQAAADYVWVNIAKTEGQILSVHGTSFEVAPFSMTERAGVLTVQRVAVKLSETTDAPSGFRLNADLIGRAVMAVGLRLEDGTIEASKITLGK